MNLVEQIQAIGIVAVIRGASPEQIVPIARALHAGGVTALEITVETPRVLKVIETVAQELGDDVIVGAGTVLDAETARAVILAGARFIFSPTVRVETVQMAKRYGVTCISGALTPTEILTAYEHGADIVKVFPASVMGPRYIKDVHGPLPQIPLMPTGGIDLSNLKDYIKAGAVAAGIGSSLVNTKQRINESSLKHMQQTATELVQAVREARAS